MAKKQIDAEQLVDNLQNAKFGLGVLNGNETHPLKNTLLLTINTEI